MLFQQVFKERESDPSHELEFVYRKVICSLVSSVSPFLDFLSLVAQQTASHADHEERQELDAALSMLDRHRTLQGNPLHTINNSFRPENSST